MPPWGAVSGPSRVKEVLTGHGRERATTQKPCTFRFKFILFFFFLAAPHGLRGLSSPTRGQTRPSAVKAWGPNHWTAREFPQIHAINTQELFDSVRGTIHQSKSRGEN